MKILSTKILPEKLILYASAQHLQLECINFIQIVPQEFDFQNTLFDEYDAIIFTSPNAINFFFKVYKKKLIPPIFTLNQSSKNIIATHSKRVTYFSNATEIANALITNHAKNVLHICGKQKLSILYNACRTHYIHYHILEVYDTQLYPQVVDINRFNGVMFFSPSGVKSFFINNRITHQQIALIGQSTFLELKNHAVCPTVPIFVSSDSSIISMINFFAKK